MSDLCRQEFPPELCKQVGCQQRGGRTSQPTPRSDHPQAVPRATAGGFGVQCAQGRPSRPTTVLSCLACGACRHRWMSPSTLLTSCGSLLWMRRLVRHWKPIHPTMRQSLAVWLRSGHAWRPCSASSTRKARCGRQLIRLHQPGEFHSALLSVRVLLCLWNKTQTVLTSAASPAVVQAEPGVVHRRLVASHASEPPDGNGQGQWPACWCGRQRQAEPCAPGCLHQWCHNVPDHRHKGGPDLIPLLARTGQRAGSGFTVLVWLPDS